MHASDWIAFVALLVSVVALAGGRFRDRRELMVRLHERLVDVELARGRRILFDVTGAGVGTWWSTVAKEDLDAVNRSLAFFDIFAYYVHRHYVRKADALDLWAVPIARAWAAAEPYIEYRSRREERVLWPYFRRFAAEAKAHAGKD